jgi:hypothetical protein
VGDPWGFPGSAKRRVLRSRVRSQPLTEATAKIAVCEIVLDRQHQNDESMLHELFSRFPGAEPADLAALEFWLAWAVTNKEEPTIGTDGVRQILDHQRRLLRYTH